MKMIQLIIIGRNNNNNNKNNDNKNNYLFFPFRRRSLCRGCLCSSLSFRFRHCEKKTTFFQQATLQVKFVYEKNVLSSPYCIGAGRSCPFSRKYRKYVCHPSIKAQQSMTNPITRKNCEYVCMDDIKRYLRYMYV